jgi:DNA ligase-associated metallophosphoesterase
MTAAPLHIAGTHVLLDPLGALYWPERRLLAVADLHLEKGTRAATRGQLVPPWDTRTTLDRLTLLLRRYRPETLVALGDSFDDSEGPQRMLPREADRLAAIADAARVIWVQGNHDPALPANLPGEPAATHADGRLTFRHIGGAAIAAGWAEICGHHHPKAVIPARAAHVSRPCFVTDGRRIMLPAFGAYTGGLDVRHPAIAGLFPRGGRVFLLGQERLFSFAFQGVRAQPRLPVGEVS